MENLMDRILILANPDKAKWWENYVKHDTAFLGVAMKDLRQALKLWMTEGHYKDDQMVEAVKDFFKGRYAEEKLLGILLMAEHMQHVQDDLILDLVEAIIHHVTDWNICDWLCVKVLGPRVKPGGFVTRLHRWSTSDYLWLRRAALVPFAKVDHAIYKEDIFIIASRLLKAPERFSKTAVGWILREMMPNHATEVVAFLKDHRMDLTTEVLNNVLKHAEDKDRLKKTILTH